MTGPQATDLRTTGFQSASECTDELERWVSHQPMTFEGRKNAGRQVQCARCFRWKYADERCNLFVQQRQDGSLRMSTPPTSDLMSQLRLVRPNAKYEFAKDQFLMIGKVMREAADTIERLQLEIEKYKAWAAACDPTPPDVTENPSAT